MATIAGWQPSEIWRPGVTLRDLIVAHDTALVTSWDQTSNIVATIYNLTVVVINAAGGKGRVKPKSASQFHPYRKRKREGMRITPKSINSLRQMAGILFRKR